MFREFDDEEGWSTDRVVISHAGVSIVNMELTASSLPFSNSFIFGSDQKKVIDQNGHDVSAAFSGKEFVAGGWGNFHPH